MKESALLKAAELHAARGNTEPLKALRGRQLCTNQCGHGARHASNSPPPRVVECPSAAALRRRGLAQQGRGVNAGVKMHRFAGAKIHQ
jgi:hypothetical protein